MAKKEPDLGQQYRAAKAAVGDHLRKWGDAEQALVAWLRAKRGVPSHVLYDATTGAPLDPQLAELEQAVTDAETDYRWCKALVVACGEAIKGASLDEVLAAQGPRPTIAKEG